MPLETKSWAIPLGNPAVRYCLIYLFVLFVLWSYLLTMLTAHSSRTMQSRPLELLPTSLITTTEVERLCGATDGAVGCTLNSLMVVCGRQERRSETSWFMSRLTFVREGSASSNMSDGSVRNGIRPSLLMTPQSSSCRNGIRLTTAIVFVLISAT